MKKDYVLFLLLLVLILGLFIGLCIPCRLFTSECPTSLLPVCSHSFWDWLLRVLQVVGALAAVIVALFKEDWMAYWYKPSLSIDTTMDDFTEHLIHEGENDVAGTYEAKLRFTNMGKLSANNMSIFVERILYRQSSDSLTSEDLLEEPFALLLDKGNDSINLPKYGEKSTVWLSLMKSQVNPSKQRTPKFPQMNMFIGRSFQVAPSYHSGILDVTFKVVCDNLKPQYKTIRVQWDGTWRSRKQELSNVFKYQWLNVEWRNV